MDWTARRDRFRAHFAEPRCFHPASVFDPMSARIAEDLGFEMGMFAGSVASMTVLGAPDLIVLTLSEFAGQAYRICRAGNLALVVDADHGYGNALNVMRTVEELESAGVSALSIEDTELPAPFGATSPRLLGIDEGVGKMKAAVAARQDPRLVIAARTSAPGISDIDDTVRRIEAYQSTGVDAIFLVGLKTRAQLEAVSAAATLPLILGSTPAELADRDYLATQGVRIALQGHAPIAAAMQAVETTLAALRAGTAPADLAGVGPSELMQRITRKSDYDGWTGSFLR